MSKADHYYSIWYGLTGTFLECIVIRNTQEEHSVRLFDIDTKDVTYVTRTLFAEMLRTARSNKSISVMKEWGRRRGKYE